MILVDNAKETIIYKTLIGLLYVSLCLSNKSEIDNTIILNLQKLFFSTDFKTIL